MMATARWATLRQDTMATTMATGDDDNNVDGDTAMGNESNDDGDGATGNEVDDNGDGATGNDNNDDNDGEVR
jgi:hypothetical protein